MDAVANLFLSFRGRYDFISTDRAHRLPYGAGVDLLSFEALQTAHEEATAPRDREHVVPFIKWNPERFPCLELTTSVDLSGTLSLSIDTPEDLARNEALITGLAEQGPPPYHLHDILRIAESLARSGGVRSGRYRKRNQTKMTSSRWRAARTICGS